MSQPEADIPVRVREAVDRLLPLIGAMSEGERRALGRRLAEAGVEAGSGGSGGSGGAVGARGTGDSTEALRAALSLSAGEPADTGRALELCAALCEVVSSLDQVVWSTWKVIAPGSSLKRTGPAKATMARFVAGHPEPSKAQVRADLERLRQLTAALTASIGQAGRQFAQKHVEKLAPAEVEGLARMSSGSVMVGHEVRCWRKYVELAGPMDAQAIERDLLAAIAAYAETLVRSAGR